MKMKIAISIATPLSLCAISAPPALAEGDADRGEMLAYTCLGYRDGTREHPTMTAQATSMSDQDIEDVKLLARYYSRLEGLETTQLN